MCVCRAHKRSIQINKAKQKPKDVRCVSVSEYSDIHLSFLSKKSSFLRLQSVSLVALKK